MPHRCRGGAAQTLCATGAPSRAALAGGYLATASASSVALIDLSSGLTISHLPQGSLVQAIEASPAGDLIAVGTCGQSIQLWDVKSRTLRRRIALTQECAESVSFSPDGTLVATGAYGCCSGGGREGLQVWDVRTGELARELAKGSGIRAVVFSRDGRWLVGVDDKGKAWVFEWPSGRQVRTYEGLAGAGASESVASASPDGRYLAWLGNHGLHVWDMSSGAQVPLPGARAVTVRDFSPGRPERAWTEERVTASTVEFLNDGRLAYVDDDRVVIMTMPAGPVQVIALAEPKMEGFGDVAIAHSLRWLTRSLDPTRMVEEALREIVDKAALLRFLTAVRLGDELPDPSVLGGIGDVCSEIEDLAQVVKRSLPVDALMALMRVTDDDSSAPGAGQSAALEGEARRVSVTRHRTVGDGRRRRTMPAPGDDHRSGSTFAPAQITRRDVVLQREAAS